MGALHQGRLVLHPTETLISLSGDPHRREAAAAACRIKGYDFPRPFLCLVHDSMAARSLAAAWTDAAERLAAAFWPGPLTLVVRAAPGAPEAVATGGTLAIRPASDPVSRALLEAWGGPLFSTSANRRGEPAPVVLEEAAARLGGGPGSETIALGLSGRIGLAAGQEPSSIVDVAGPPRLLRPGAISLERLREVVRSIAAES